MGGELAQARAEGHGRVFRARRLLNAAEDAIRLGLRRGIRRPLASFVEGSAQDLRYAVRALVRRPAYVAGAVFALALGIGANTAIFSIVHGVLFHPLPYAEPDRLMLLWGDGSRRGLTTFAGAPPAEFLAWTARASSFTGMAALSNNSVAFTQFDEPLVPLTHVVTENYFDVLGVEPYLGRTFEAGDATGTGVVVVSHRIWQRSLGGDPALIGKTVVLDDEPFVVIGILRPDFYSTHQLPVQPDLWMPTVFAGREQDRATRNNAVFARLKPGVTVAQAQQEMSAIAADAEAEFPESNSGWSVKVTPVRDNTVGAYRQTFGFLLLAVGLVLLIACANVANLGLAHAIERSREVALRSALGAGRGRLLRQMVSEGLVLATLGGGVGVLVAFAALPVLLRLIPGTGAGGSTTIGGLAAVPFLEHVGVNSTVLGFAAVLCVLTGIVAALAPARVAGRQTLSSALQDGSRGSTTGGARRTTARSLGDHRNSGLGGASGGSELASSELPQPAECGARLRRRPDHHASQLAAHRTRSGSLDIAFRAGCSGLGGVTGHRVCQRCELRAARVRQCPDPVPWARRGVRRGAQPQRRGAYRDARLLRDHGDRAAERPHDRPI